MADIQVVYDGTNFVPAGPVDLPAGTKAIVQISPITMSYSSPQPPRMTAEQQKQWDEMVENWRQASWPWVSVEDALGRPRYAP